MGFKGVYKQKTSFFKTGIFLALMFISFVLHTFLAYLLFFLFSDINFSINSYIIYSNNDEVFFLKVLQLFSTIGLFISPLIAYSYLTSFNFKWNFHISKKAIFLALLVMLLSHPFISFIYEWNMSLNLPNYLTSYDQKNKAITLLFIKADTIGTLLFNILVLAIAPAIGEELLFRGYLQVKLSNFLKNSHISIFLVAIFFSAIHMQFNGFIPRFFLGLLLGYFFYWSGSLMLVVIVHLFNNAIIVLFSYPILSSYSKLINTNFTTNEILISLLGLSLILFYFQKECRIKKS